MSNEQNNTSASVSLNDDTASVNGGYVLHPEINNYTNNVPATNAGGGSGSTSGNEMSGGTVITNTGRGPRNSGIYPAPDGGADRGAINGTDESPIIKPLPDRTDLILHNTTGTYLNKNAVICIESNLGGGSRVTMWDGRFYDFALPPSKMADQIGNTLDVTKNAAPDTTYPTSSGSASSGSSDSSSTSGGSSSSSGSSGSSASSGGN